MKKFLTIFICIFLVMFSSKFVYAQEETSDETIIEVPSNIEIVSNGYNKIIISWEEIEEATGYEIEVKEDGEWISLDDVNKTSYTHKDLICGQKYTYRIRAYKETGEEFLYSDYTESVSQKLIPKAPEELEAVATSSQSVTLTWNKVSGATGYRIYLQSDDGWRKIKDTTKTSYVDADTAKKAGTEYTYMVRAYRLVDGDKILGVKDEEGCTVTTKPAEPKGITVSYTSNKMTIKWQKVSSSDGYRIYRKKAGSSEWKVLADVMGKKTVSYIDKKAKRGISYVYTVAALKNGVVGTHNQRGVYRVCSSLSGYSYAANIVNSVTTSNMSNLQKLRACYNWYPGRTRYTHRSGDPLYIKGSSWMNTYAVDMFKYRKGNCYRFACSLAYMAKTLGFNPKVVVGVFDRNRAKHGWVEITINGRRYIWDVGIRVTRGRKDLCKTTYSNSLRYTAKKRFSLPV
jgi:fibronectin type 3 domain-containing protein